MPNLFLCVAGEKQKCVFPNAKWSLAALVSQRLITAFCVIPICL